MEQLPRIESGIAGLDILLKGGLVAGASYIVQGRPGSGKTIFASQIAFHHAARGGRVLFATLLSETHERLFQFLSTMEFFRRERIGAEMQFVSAFDTLENEGLDEVVKLLRREISRQKASVMVVDGVLNARSRAETSLDTKRFIAELQGHAAFAGCTVLFLTSARLDDGSPEHTMVDGVIELGEELIGSRSIRRLHLRKTRGSGAIPGLHDFEITSHGLVVHPRLESVWGRTASPEAIGTRRESSGVPALDEMLGGGLPSASVTLALGPSGSGKTTLGLHFLSRCSAEEPGLLFGFYETPERLCMKAASLGIDLRGLIASGAVEVLWQTSAERSLDGLGHKLLQAVERRRVRRLMIDSLSGVARASARPERLIDFHAALANELRERHVTTMASWEMNSLFGAEIHAPAPELSSLVDNLLMLRFVEAKADVKRVMGILKVRDSDYDSSLREFSVRGDGIHLGRGFERMASVLSGAATIAGS
ncbi:serine/threonine protein kinase [Pseudoroseomonas rhizosphaerae]|uniref:non-specific serine/threonine protein kinase n=1 Tax=Teichococcus rhizosphaerae TaxID=1335062 RepID=A0A2C6Y3F7_9PROT|nr:ATPase domain-containing protein [Pseudoroseomonas rhizosphaerae]PHK95342.1 serine/threonine protein kinase [Pseudoroseomonas rhizosphaerae]